MIVSQSCVLLPHDEPLMKNARFQDASCLSLRELDAEAFDDASAIRVQTSCCLAGFNIRLKDMAILSPTAPIDSVKLYYYLDRA